MKAGVSKKVFKKIDRFERTDGSALKFDSYKKLKRFLKSESCCIKSITSVDGKSVAVVEKLQIIAKTQNSLSMAGYTALALMLAFSGFAVAHAATNGGFATLSQTVSGVVRRVSEGDNVFTAISTTVKTERNKKSAVKTGSAVEWDASENAAQGEVISAVDKVSQDTKESSEKGVPQPDVQAVDVKSIQGDVETYNGDYFELQVFGDLLIDSTFPKVTVSNEKENNCVVQVQFDISLNDGTAFTVLSDKVAAGKSVEVDLYTPVIESMSDVVDRCFGTVLITTHCYAVGETTEELNGLVQEVSINVSR